MSVEPSLIPSLTPSISANPSMSVEPSIQPSSRALARTCVLIKTGTGEYDDGYLDVLVNTGTGYVIVKQGTLYTQGQTVLDVCYKRLVGVQVTNSLTNAWAGSIETSVDERDSYSPMMCIDGCHGTSTTGTTEYIIVDGDATIGIGDAKCFNGGILFPVSVLWLFYYCILLLNHLANTSCLCFSSLTLFLLFIIK